MSLQGRTVLVTRPVHQADDLVRPLEALGAKTIRMPAIEILPASDPAPLDAALREVERYDWVVFTSVNGVEAVRDRVAALGLDPARISSRHLAVVGTSTADALTQAFRAPDLLPGEFRAEAIALEPLSPPPRNRTERGRGEGTARQRGTEGTRLWRGQRLLLLRADRARSDLVDALRAQGAEVDDVVAYRIARAEGGVELPAEAPDAITLTSSESARATFAALQRNSREAWFGTAALICIGPVTAETVRELGYEPAAVAKEYTIPGLIEALKDHLTGVDQSISIPKRVESGDDATRFGVENSSESSPRVCNPGLEEVAPSGQADLSE